MLSQRWKPVVLVHNSVLVTALIHQVAGGVPVVQETKGRMPIQKESGKACEEGT